MGIVFSVENPQKYPDLPFAEFTNVNTYKVLESLNVEFKNDGKIKHMELDDLVKKIDNKILEESLKPDPDQKLISRYIKLADIARFCIELDSDLIWRHDGIF